MILRAGSLAAIGRTHLLLNLLIHELLLLPNCESTKNKKKKNSDISLKNVKLGSYDETYRLQFYSN